MTAWARKLIHLLNLSASTLYVKKTGNENSDAIKIIVNFYVAMYWEE
jgi:hypothetical protein